MEMAENTVKVNVTHPKGTTFVVSWKKSSSMVLIKGGSNDWSAKSTKRMAKKRKKDKPPEVYDMIFRLDVIKIIYSKRTN